jgi:hypothetical protein
MHCITARAFQQGAEPDAEGPAGLASAELAAQVSPSALCLQQGTGAMK